MYIYTYAYIYRFLQCSNTNECTSLHIHIQQCPAGAQTHCLAIQIKGGPLTQMHHGSAAYNLNNAKAADIIELWVLNRLQKQGLQHTAITTYTITSYSYWYLQHDLLDSVLQINADSLVQSEFAK